VDYIKEFQQKTLAIICPLAGNSCLKKCEYRFSVDALHKTYQGIPLLYIIEGMNTNTKVPYEAEDLNPKQ
jgi:hypothetical protein